VKREVLSSSRFERDAKRLTKRQPLMAEKLEAVLNLLAADAHHPLLHTHKLTGQLEDAWSCTVAYDMRVVFKFVEYEGREAILLRAVGTHDQAY